MTAPFSNRIPTQLLLVDDDPSMVRLLTKIIDRSFGDVMAMRSLVDPTEARDVIESELVDILVTDLEMPGINGLGLLRCAKRRNALTQVLFITGRSSLDTLTDALELGASDYLLKPFDQSAIIRILDEAQRRVQRWREALAGTFETRRNHAATSTR